jgi:hypothetical protein
MSVTSSELGAVANACLRENQDSDAQNTTKGQLGTFGSQ